MGNKKRWTSSDMPDLTGKIAIVTGANIGIGFETSRALARKGAHVVMACRNLIKGENSANEIRNELDKSEIELIKLDLSSLSSIRRFVDDFKENSSTLNLLINNAGVMMPPYSKTVDGFELQFGTNHLGHFALTGLLLDTLMKTGNSRVVTAGSSAHNFGSIDFEDLNWEKSYKRIGAYGRSKLANLLFTYELQRKLEAAGSTTIAIAVHPGWTRTALQRNSMFLRFLNPIFGQNVEKGALPTLYAATSEDVRGGEYYGPGGWKELRGYPKKVESNEMSHDTAIAGKLWAVSEKLTGVRYKGLNRSASQ